MMANDRAARAADEANREIAAELAQEEQRARQMQAYVERLERENERYRGALDYIARIKGGFPGVGLQSLSVLHADAVNVARAALFSDEEERTNP